MVYGKGYSNNHSSVKDPCFLTWRNMLKRCYSDEEKYEEYRRQGVSVCDEWLNFEIFQKWYDRNYYEVGNEQMQLDKDILKHGNLMYCPEYCVFVPRNINALFIRSKNRRNGLPIGVSKKKYGYLSCCSVFGENIKSNHKDPISAFEEYKRIKESYIKTVANQYKDKIPENLYNAMMMFEVKIDD